MRYLRFLLSGLFFKNLFLATISGGVLVALTLLFLNIITHHNDYQKVPDLEAVALDLAIAALENEDLRYEVLDSAKFNPNYPPLVVLEHLPEAGAEVKTNRKIYLTVNPSGYRNVSIPNIIQITRRNAVSTLKAVGLEVGSIYYRDNIGKNMVLEIQYDGNKITPGASVPRTSKIDLVLGNGKR
jgi:beta-lactam-binding protein with PASTA domain